MTKEQSQVNGDSLDYFNKLCPGKDVVYWSEVRDFVLVGDKEPDLQTVIRSVTLLDRHVIVIPRRSRRPGEQHCTAATTETTNPAQMAEGDPR